MASNPSNDQDSDESKDRNDPGSPFLQQMIPVSAYLYISFKADMADTFIYFLYIFIGFHRIAFYFQQYIYTGSILLYHS